MPFALSDCVFACVTGTVGVVDNAAVASVCRPDLKLDVLVTAVLEVSHTAYLSSFS